MLVHFNIGNEYLVIELSFMNDHHHEHKTLNIQTERSSKLPASLFHTIHLAWILIDSLQDTVCATTFTLNIIESLSSSLV